MSSKRVVATSPSFNFKIVERKLFSHNKCKYWLKTFCLSFYWRKFLILYLRKFFFSIIFKDYRQSIWPAKLLGIERKKKITNDENILFTLFIFSLSAFSREKAIEIYELNKKLLKYKLNIKLVHFISVNPINFNSWCNYVCLSKPMLLFTPLSKCKLKHLASE